MFKVSLFWIFCLSIFEAFVGVFCNDARHDTRNIDGSIYPPFSDFSFYSHSMIGELSHAAAK